MYIFNHRLKRRLDGLHNLILQLTARHYLGLVGEVAYPPVSLQPPSCAAGFYPLGLFCYTWCITTTLNVWQKIEGSATHSRVPLSNGFVRRFPKEDLKLSENYLPLSISAQSSEILLPPDSLILFSVSYIVDEFLFNSHLV